VLRTTLKDLMARKRRLIRTALSIVLGVGFVAGTFVLTDTMNEAFDDLFTQVASGSDVIVRSVSAFDASEAGPGGGGGAERSPVPEDLVATVEAVPGVAAAEGGVGGYAQMVDPATGEAIGGVGPPTLGTNWNVVANASLELRSGSAPTGADDVVVDAATAKEHDLSVGQRIRILFQGPPGEFTISGVVGFGNADNLAGATLVLFDTPTAQRVLDREGEFDEIDVVAEPGVSEVELRNRIQQVLPDDVEAVTSAAVADEQSQQLKEALGFFRTTLLVFAFIALFVGAFVIFNTFSIIVAQRTRELALLRALGASSGQVLSSVVLEALIVGLVGSILGIVAGLGIAVLLQGLLAAFGIDLPSTSTQLEPRTIVVALLVGTVVTVVSSILPARRASRVAPLQAMRSQEGAADGSLHRRLIAGGVVLGLGIASLLYGLFGNQSNAGALIGLGAAATFIGVSMLAPLVARRLAGAIGAPIRGLGVQARLGRENAMRNPRRTSSTASALMIGLGLVAMVAILSASLKASFDAALAETLKADFILSTSSFTPFSPDVAEQVAGVDGVQTVAQFRQGGFRVNDQTSFLTGTDPATLGAVTSIDLTSGSVDSLADDHTVLVHDLVAEDNGWTVGDEVPASFSTIGDTPLVVGGIFTENGVVGDYVVSLDAYEGFFTQQLDSFAMVTVADGADPAAVQRGIEAVTEPFGNIEVQDQAAFREKQAGFINQLLGLVTALLFMAILIALFGIMNTLSLSILERTHELGLLRAVGMSRRQVKRMVRWESVIIAILGAVLGLAIGIFFGWSLQQAIANEGVTELRIPAGQLVIYLVIAGLAGVLAAIPPARRAARLNVLEAIAYE
jgi:putative ABC transport system permease protein